MPITYNVTSLIPTYVLDAAFPDLTKNIFFRKFAPKFVVELESVVEVYPTDDIQFVCVIDDTLEKVWWEKDGKEVRFVSMCYHESIVTHIEVWVKN